MKLIEYSYIRIGSINLFASRRILANFYFFHNDLNLLFDSIVQIRKYYFIRKKSTTGQKYDLVSQAESQKMCNIIKSISSTKLVATILIKISNRCRFPQWLYFHLQNIVTLSKLLRTTRPHGVLLRIPGLLRSYHVTH